MVVVALLLLLAKSVDVVHNLHEGWIRMLGFYPLTRDQAVGYDLEKLAEIVFIAWVAYRFVRSRVHGPHKSTPLPEG